MTGRPVGRPRKTEEPQAGAPSVDENLRLECLKLASGRFLTLRDAYNAEAVIGLAEDFYRFVKG